MVAETISRSAGRAAVACALLLFASAAIYSIAFGPGMRPASPLSLSTLLAQAASHDISSLEHDRPEEALSAPSFATSREPCLEDVQSSFETIPANGSRLAFWSGDVGDTEGLIPWPEYSLTPENRFGLNNHFQGVQRLANGPYLAVTGADKDTQQAHLFIVHMGSRTEQGLWGSNLQRRRHPRRWWRKIEQPDQADTIAKRIDLDNQLWHAGGLDALGDLIAIPLTNGGDSRIVFYDVADLALPLQLETAIELPNTKAYAVAITRVSDGRFLAAILTDASVEFVLSRSDDLADGFEQEATSRLQVDDSDQDSITEAQNLNFIGQCDGSMYMIAFWNTTAVAPVIPGDDLALLYELTFPSNDFTQSPALQPRSRRTLDCGGECNFDGAAGAYITSDQNLVVYATSHFRGPLTPLDLLLDGPTVIRLLEY